MGCVARRRGRGRLPWAGERYAPVPATSALRAGVCPAVVMAPGWRRHRGLRCRYPAQAWHPCSGALEPGEVAQCCPHGDGHPCLAHHAAPAGLRPPGAHARRARIVPCRCEPREACRMGVHRTDRCLQDAVLRRCGADHCREPPERGRAPGGSAGGARARLSKQAVRRHGGGRRSLRVAARARVRARRASSSPVGTETAVRSPERARRARGMASLRSVVTRSPALGGRREGATTQQAESFFFSYRESQEPQGPAAETTRRCVACDRLLRRSGSMSHGRVPRVPREVPAAPGSGATSGPAMVSLGRPCDEAWAGRRLADLRVESGGGDGRRLWLRGSSPAFHRGSTYRHWKSLCLGLSKK